MKGSISAARISGIPESLDGTLLIDAMLGGQFMMLHRLDAGDTLLVRGESPQALSLERAVAGLELGECNDRIELSGRLLCLVAIEPKGRSNTISNLCRLFSGLDASVLVSFVPASAEEVKTAKLRAEEMLSLKETAATRSVSSRGEAYSETASMHTELYYGSDEKGMLLEILEMLNSAMLSNGKAYRIAICLSGDYAPLLEYLRSRMLVLEERKLEAGSLEELHDKMKRIEALPFDAFHAANMLGFSRSVRVNKTLAVPIAKQEGDLPIGHQLEGAVGASGEQLLINASSLNLGTLISGVPGTGKTLAAMSIIRGLTGVGKTRILIISPTAEWNSFGHAEGMRIIRFYGSEVGFNFFKCDSGINIERFYENLAMLIASASDAGPYTNTLEKCLLSAFRRVYTKTRCPDPVEVYGEIEEAIVEQHGKRTSVGVKYTKHGENARAALENLRSMLNRPEFSKPEGASFRELLESGVVFDLSMVSNKMKPFFYALILNQAYSLADELDALGDRELRMLLCVEEAQLAFPDERFSATTLDLAQRIQDFRKRGVGLMLIAHNATDIEPDIRRLCQTKLYFRQSADVAKFAANDLIFDEEQKDALVERLKSLEQRVCAINFIRDAEGERSQAGAVFVRMPQCAAPPEQRSTEGNEPTPRRGTTKVKVTDKDGAPKEGIRVQLVYLSEKKYEGATDVHGETAIDDTITGNRYRLLVLGEKKRDTKSFSVIGGELNIVEI